MAVALPYIAIALATTAAATSAIGAAQQGAAAQKNANYQAAVAQNNKTIADQNAAAVTQQGEIVATNRSIQASQQLGKAKAAFAAAGVTDYGSVGDTLGGIARVGALDSLTIKNNAARQAYGYQVQGANFEAQAGIDLLSGTSAKQAGDIRSIGSVLGGASSIAGMSAGFAQSGAFGGGGGYNYDFTNKLTPLDL